MTRRNKRNAKYLHCGLNDKLRSTNTIVISTLKEMVRPREKSILGTKLERNPGYLCMRTVMYPSCSTDLSWWKAGCFAIKAKSWSFTFNVKSSRWTCTIEWFCQLEIKISTENSLFNPVNYQKTTINAVFKFIYMLPYFKSDTAS